MAKVKQCIPKIVFILFITIGICKAEPVPSVNYLMNEPASMFDIGLMRLKTAFNNHVGDWKIGGIEPKLYAYYDWNKNRIFINVSYGFYNETPKYLTTQVENMILLFKKTLFGLDDIGMPDPQVGSSTLYRYFDHDSYQSQNRPKNLGIELDSITEIGVAVWISGKDKPPICESPLIGKNFFWKREGF